MACGVPGCTRLPPPAGVWKEMLSAGDLPSARSLHSAVLKDNVMYVLGGQDENGPVDVDLHAYDLSGVPYHVVHAKTFSSEIIIRCFNNM